MPTSSASVPTMTLSTRAFAERHQSAVPADERSRRRRAKGVRRTQDAGHYSRARDLRDRSRRQRFSTHSIRSSCPRSHVTNALAALRVRAVSSSKRLICFAPPRLIEATRRPSNRTGVPARCARRKQCTAARKISRASRVGSARCVCRPKTRKSARLILIPTVDGGAILAFELLGDLERQARAAPR